MGERWTWRRAKWRWRCTVHTALAEDRRSIVDGENINVLLYSRTCVLLPALSANLAREMVVMDTIMRFCEQGTEFLGSEV